MKDRKRRLELYSFYDHTGIERHLERMAEKGWMLEKVENNIWHYRRIKPEKLTFFVTYFPRASELDPEPGEEQKIFFDFCEHTGWKLAAVSAQQQIFYNESPDPVPIATDPQVELETVRRSARKSFLPGIWVLLACGLAVTVMSAIRLRQDPIGALSSAAWLFSSLAWLLVILYGASELAGYFAWCHGAKKAAARGEFLETSSRVWLGLDTMRATLAVSMGMPVMSEMPRAIQRLWLYPLSRSFCRDKGMGMMRPMSLKKPLRLSSWAIMRPMFRPISGRLWYFRSKRMRL